MTPLQIIFILVGAITLGAALMVVLTKNMVHAALWLVLSLFGVAIVFVLLSAGFLAVAQVVIYIGAIAILMIFAIMLTRRVVKDVGSQIISGWFWVALFVTGVFGGLVWMLSEWKEFHAIAPALTNTTDTITSLGIALVSPDAYLIPFEIASVLLVAALIGSILVAWDRK